MKSLDKSEPIIDTPLDVLKIRESLGLKQDEFSALLNISISTTQSWEQQEKNKSRPLRIPNGPSKTLLRLLDKYPEEMMQLLKNL